MDFAFSDEQREFKALCRRFADEVIRPVAARHDAEESTPWEVIGAAREWGLHGIEHLQRMANDPDGQFAVIYAEELHRGCAARLAAAIPEAQSLSSTRLTATGPFTPPLEGKTASATPAASATGSGPATRVVFLVAKTGKPRSCMAGACSGTTMLGAGAGCLSPRSESIRK